MRIITKNVRINQPAGFKVIEYLQKTLFLSQVLLQCPPTNINQISE